MNDITSPIKIKNISPNISIRKNKNNEKHILISPAHKNYNMNILKSPFKSKSPFNLTKRKIDRKYFNKEKIPFYQNSKTISNNGQNTIENHYTSFITEISINNGSKKQSDNQMSLKSPFESKRKKKTISELLFDKKPNILIKKRNLSSINLKKTNENNKNVKNDYNNNSNFLFSLCKQDEKNKNEIIFHKKKFTPKKEHHIRYNLNDFNDKNIIRNAPSKISLIQREKSSNNIIPKIKLKPLNENNKSYILIHPEYNDIKSKNSKLNKKKNNFRNNIKNEILSNTENKDIDTSSYNISHNNISYNLNFSNINSHLSNNISNIIDDVISNKNLSNKIISEIISGVNFDSMSNNNTYDGKYKHHNTYDMKNQVKYNSKIKNLFDDNQEKKLKENISVDNRININQKESISENKSITINKIGNISDNNSINHNKTEKINDNISNDNINNENINNENINDDNINIDNINNDYIKNDNIKNDSKINDNEIFQDNENNDIYKHSFGESHIESNIPNNNTIKQNDEKNENNPKNNNNELSYDTEKMSQNQIIKSPKIHTPKNISPKISSKGVTKKQSDISILKLENKSQTILKSNKSYYGSEKENEFKEKENEKENENENEKEYDLEKPQIKKYIKSHISISQAGKEENGKIKTNQDSYLELININNNPNFNIFGIFDGHGTKGHLISQYIVKYIKNYFESKKNPISKIPNNEIYSYIKKDNYSFIKNLIKTSEENLNNEKEIDSNFSGTTCNLIIQINNKIICSNIGDSRSIMVKDKKTIIQLSFDQKPDDENERKRIEENNGEVHKLIDEEEGEIGPMRVFMKGEKFPGIAMSRSIGDKVASQLGVISLPDIREFDIEDTCKFIVIASDGIWEFLSKEKVTHYVNKFYKKNNIYDAALKLVKKSTSCWEKEDNVIDDITVIVIFFNMDEQDND